MRADYQPYFEQLKKRMDNFGYISIKERELDAEFFLPNGWKLEFSGELHYGPMLGIDLVAPSNIGIKRGHKFSREDGTEIISYDLTTLVRVFERLKGKVYKELPKNDAVGVAMEFLRREREAIFADPKLYEEEYLALSDLPLEEINAVIASHKAGIVTPAATKPPSTEPPQTSVVTA